jgi:hypothetical protein
MNLNRPLQVLKRRRKPEATAARFDKPEPAATIAKATERTFLFVATKDLTQRSQRTGGGKPEKDRGVYRRGAEKT